MQNAIKPADLLLILAALAGTCDEYVGNWLQDLQVSAYLLKYSIIIMFSSSLSNLSYRQRQFGKYHRIFP